MLAAQSSEASGSLMLAVLITLGLAFYFIPTVIAVARQHPNTAPIVIVNVMLGWTLVGYAVALAWAFLAIDRERYPLRRHGHARSRRTANPYDQSDPSNPFDFNEN